MAFAKILDFWRGLKTRYEALKRYFKWLGKSKLLLGTIFCWAGSQNFGPIISGPKSRISVSNWAVTVIWSGPIIHVNQQLKNHALHIEQGKYFDSNLFYRYTKCFCCCACSYIKLYLHVYVWHLCRLHVKFACVWKVVAWWIGESGFLTCNNINLYLQCYLSYPNFTALANFQCTK